MSGNETRMLGRWGEMKTAEYLRKKGYTILAAGYHCRYGEIDLIAADKNFICFVEVKLRKSSQFAHAREFVDIRKQNRIRMTAEFYLQEIPVKLQPRFDVAEVYAPEGISTKNLQINYLENAF